MSQQHIDIWNEAADAFTQRYDAVTGQYHFWARTYSPTLGRWLQRDPLGYVDGVSLYEYAVSDPIGWVRKLRWHVNDAFCCRTASVVCRHGYRRTRDPHHQHHDE